MVFAEYVPPSSRRIKERQNDLAALRLLIAQRRLHARAKFWQAIRWTGLLVIGLAAPVVSVVWPDLAVAMGAIAGGWLFVGRTLLTWRISTITSQAAAVQEEFDQYVFNMPESIDRSIRPSLEEIAAIAGPDEVLQQVADAEKLVDWYPIDQSSSGAVAVAVCQRANAAYSDRLLRKLVTVWTVASASWALILVLVTILVGLSLPTFLMGVILPLLPATLDVVEYLVSVRKAARERGDLARTIEGRLAAQPVSVEGGELLVWQGQMFELRRVTPQVPDLLYRLTRSRNEKAMHTAAGQLAGREERD